VAGSIAIIDTSIPTQADRNIFRMIYFSEWRIRVVRSFAAIEIATTRPFI
jgi:hypothetical protein